MPADDSGWGFFDPPAKRGPAGDPARRDLAVAFARCFGSDAGNQVLAHLRAVTVERVLGPATAAETLRHVEGQRHLVAYLQTMIDRGRDGSSV